LPRPISRRAVARIRPWAASGGTSETHAPRVRFAYPGYAPAFRGRSPDKAKGRIRGTLEVHAHRACFVHPVTGLTAHRPNPPQAAHGAPRDEKWNGASRARARPARASAG